MGLAETYTPTVVGTVIVVLVLGVVLALPYTSLNLGNSSTGNVAAVAINEEGTAPSRIPYAEGFIIELKDPPVLEVGEEEAAAITGFAVRPSAKEKAAAKKEKQKAYKNKLKEKQARIKNVVLAIIESPDPQETGRITGNIIAAAPNNALLGEYTMAFNGFAFNVSDKKAERIRRLPDVKGVYPNYLARTMLNDSVPQIQADDVHALDSNLNTCTGTDCLTGKGITIGILDTGVDPYHPDLSVVNQPEQLEKITAAPVIPFFYKYYSRGIPFKRTDIFIENELYPRLDNIISVDGGRVAYAEENIIYITTLADGTTQKINTTQIISEKKYTSAAPENVTLVKLYGDHLAFALTSLVGYDGDVGTTGYYYHLQRGNLLSLGNGWGIQTKSLWYQPPPLLYFSGPNLIYSTNKEWISVLNVDREPEHQHVWDKNVKLPVATDKGYSDFPPQPLSGDIVLMTESLNGDWLKTPCKTNLILFNFSSEEVKRVRPPNLGPIISAAGDTVLYAACNKNDIDYTWNTTIRYNITSGEATALSVNAPPFGERMYYSLSRYAPPSRKILKTGDNKGTIEGDLTYFSDNANTNRIIVHDNALNRNILINPVHRSIDFDTNGSLVCFLSTDFNIYCHTYDPSYPYGPVPANEKVTSWTAFYPSMFYRGVTNKLTDAMDNYGHGTHVAATAAGAGNLKGVAPGAQIAAVKVLSDSGAATLAMVLNGIEWSVDPDDNGDPSDRLDVISLSLGATCYFGYRKNECGPDDALSRSIDNAVKAGVVAVVAAGNEGPKVKTISSPGTSRLAITVGAVMKNDTLASFSSRGPVEDVDRTYLFSKPDLVAPGVNICAAQSWQDIIAGIYKSDRYGRRDVHCIDGEHIAISGTSMATPHVSGAVALLLQKNPDWTPEEVKMALKATADPLPEPAYRVGAGRLNILRAVQFKGIPAIASFATGGQAKGTMDINGTATGRTFSRYALSMGAGDQPAVWEEIASGTTPVENGVLGRLDTSVLPPGITTLQLLVYNDAGEASREVTYLTRPDPSGAAAVCTSSPCTADDTLIASKDTLREQSEPNQPNTAFPFCADGEYGTYKVDESVENIVVEPNDKLPLFSGLSPVKATATVYCYKGSIVNVVYASPTKPPVVIASSTCKQTKKTTVNAKFTLDAGSGNHTIGVTEQFYGKKDRVCGDSAFDDNDHIVITIPDCSDSDGNNEFSEGVVASAGKKLVDTCVEKGAKVLEWFCAADGASTVPANEIRSCPTSCSSGRCDTYLYNADFENTNAVIVDSPGTSSPVGIWVLSPANSSIIGKEKKRVLALSGISRAVQTVPAAGIAYTVTADHVTPKKAAGTLTIQFLGSSKTVLSEQNKQTLTGSKQVTLTSATPEGTAFVRVVLSTSLPSTKTIVQWDNVKLTSSAT